MNTSNPASPSRNRLSDALSAACSKISPTAIKIAALAVLAASFAIFLLPTTWRTGCDFELRHNEACCVRSGLGLIRMLQVSNYKLLMAAALMVLALYPAAGPFALCVLMIKPQMGLLFVIPLLLSRR